MDPVFSFVIPVFDKADVLEHVVGALRTQSVAGRSEFIFVDDSSRDGSAEKLESLGCRVVRNEMNAGPALRLNQGAHEATGRFLCLFDADVLVAPDAVERMAQAMERHNAPMAHGATVPERVAPLGPSPTCETSATPLETVIGGGFVRMGWVVERTLFDAVGGCDERIFIQDESLSLRLAVKANRLVRMTPPIAYAPPVAFRLSSDRRQQHHDRFFARYNLLRDQSSLSPGTRAALATRCVSDAYKAGLAGLTRYLSSKLIPPSDLDDLARAFAALPGIRRPDPSLWGGLPRPT